MLPREPAMTRQEFESRCAAVNAAIRRRLVFILLIPVGALVFFFEYTRNFGGLLAPGLQFGVVFAVIVGGALGMSLIITRVMAGASRSAGLVCPFCNAPLGGYMKPVRETHRCPVCSKQIIESAPLSRDRGVNNLRSGAAARSMSSSLPLRLTPNRGKLVLPLLICVGFVLCGILLVRASPILGYVGIGFFGFGAIACAVNLFPKSAYLLVDVDGFTYVSLFRKHFVSWSKVEGFVPARVGNTLKVGWNYNALHQRAKGLRKVSAALAGAEAALPDTYGRSVADLMDLLESCRATYAGDGHVSAAARGRGPAGFSG